MKIECFEHFELFAFEAFASGLGLNAFESKIISLYFLKLLKNLKFDYWFFTSPFFIGPYCVHMTEGPNEESFFEMKLAQKNIKSHLRAVMPLTAIQCFSALSSINIFDGLYKSWTIEIKIVLGSN